MFVRRLVERGAQLVRRVGDELALCAIRVLEPGEHRIEARGQATELVAAADLDPLREIAGLRHTLGGLGQPADRRQRRARHDQPEAGGDSDSAERDRDEKEPQARERLVHLGQGTGDLHRVPGFVRDGQHPDVCPVDLRLRGDRIASHARPRECDRLVGDGKLDVVVQLAQGLAVRLDDLDERVRLTEAGADAEEGLSVSQRDLGQRDAEDLLRALLEGVVDLCPELTAHHEEHDDRGKHHRQGQPPRRGADRDARPEAHERSSLAQGVADAAHRMDETRPAGELRLSAQVADVHVEGVRGGAEVVSPHSLEDDGAGQDLARVA